MLQKEGSKQVPISPVTASKLYWNVCIPKLTYGIEVMDIKRSSVELVEGFHNQAAKITQGLPEQAVNIGSLATIGWQPIDLFIDLISLLFLWRLLLLPMSNIYKNVLIRRFMHHIENYSVTSCGPVKNVLNTCVKYNLQYYVLNAIEIGEYCSMNYWKKLVKTVLKDKHVKRWHVTKPLYTSLSGFTQDICKISPWWYHAHKHPEIHKYCMLIIQLLLKKDRHEHIRCQNCKAYAESNLCHILFECKYLEQERFTLWKRVESVSVANLVNCTNSMDNISRCSFILNGFNYNYVEEWSSVYTNFAQFIYFMYTKYEKGSK